MGKTGKSERKMKEMKKEDAFASLQLSITRAGTTYQPSDGTKEAEKAATIYGSSKLENYELAAQLSRLSVNQREEYFSKLDAARAESFWKLDDAERAVQLGKLTPRQYVVYLGLRAENTGHPSTSTTAAQVVAIAVPEKDAAVATPVAVAVAAPEKAAAIATLTAAQAVAIAAPE